MNDPVAFSASDEPIETVNKMRQLKLSQCTKVLADFKKGYPLLHEIVLNFFELARLQPPSND